MTWKSMTVVAAVGASLAILIGVLTATRQTTNPTPAAVALDVEEPVRGAITSAADFVWRDGLLYVLDWRVSSVSVLELHDEGWTEIRRVGRPGSGPGELERPVAVDMTPHGRLAVLEASGEIEIFTDAGEPWRTMRVTLPCRVLRAQLRMRTETDAYIGATCRGWGGAYTPDTVYAAVWGVSADSTWTIVADAVRTVDGRWGSLYTSRWVFDHAHGRIVFGSGLTACLGHGIGTELGIELASECWLPDRYAAAPPAGFAAGLGPLRDRPAHRWPSPLPVFYGLASAGPQSVLLARPFHADSLGLVLWSAGRETWKAKAGLNSFVGCRSDGCLWYTDLPEGAMIGFWAMERLLDLGRQGTS